LQNFLYFTSNHVFIYRDSVGTCDVIQGSYAVAPSRRRRGVIAIEAVVSRII